MGGYGALEMALRHPETYDRVPALAPWLQPLSWNSYERNRTLWSRWVLVPVFGHSREESRFEGNDIFLIAAAADPATVPPNYVCTGSQDRWESGAQELVALLRKRGIAVDATSIPRATHDWADWRAATPAVLEFLTR